MNRIIKSIKRTTAMIATLAVGIITLPTLLSTNESKINPVLSIAKLEPGDVITDTFNVSRPEEINGAGLIDGPENWYRSGLRRIGSYCINAGWSSGNTGGLTIEQINKIIRENAEVTDNTPITSRTYYKRAAVHDSDLKMFEKYALSFPQSWYSRTMQQIMWALAGDPESVLHTYGGNSRPVEEAALMYENSNGEENSVSGMNVNDLNPNEIYDNYRNLTENQRPDLEEEIIGYNEEITSNEATIMGLESELEGLRSDLTRIDPNWQQTDGAEALTITATAGNTNGGGTGSGNTNGGGTNYYIGSENGQAVSYGTEDGARQHPFSSEEEAQNAANRFLAGLEQSHQDNLNEDVPKDVQTIAGIVNKILEKEAEIWRLKEINENIRNVRIPKANQELQTVNEQIGDFDDTYGGGDTVTLESITNTIKEIREAIAKARTIVDEGKKYAEFYEKMKQQANGGELSLNLVNKTDVTKVKTVVDQKNYEYIVGPFEIDYISGDYGSVTFGGITKLELEGYTNETIPIEGLIIDELGDGDLSNDTWISKDKIHYFTPSADEQVDRNPQTYPKPGKKFYVKFKDPKNGKNEAAIKGIKASSKWLECDAQVAVYRAIQYKLNYKLEKTEKTYLGVVNGEESYSDTVYYYVASDTDEEEPHQQHEAQITEQFRELKKDNEGGTTKIPVKKPVNVQKTVDLLQQNGEEQGPGVNWVDAASNRSKKELELMAEGDGGIIPLTMNLGGRVWVDKPVGKMAGVTTGLDGKRTEGQDENLPGVEVILHNYTLEKERGEEVIARSYNYDEKNFNYNEGTPLLCKTVTDEEGKYFFTGLKPQYKYYVEFIYNGAIYEPTYFTDNFEPDYSHATDTVLTRKEFNESFETINPADECYTVKRPVSGLGFAQGSKNKVYSLWKYSNDYQGNDATDSMKSKNGIREIYEQLIKTVAKYAHDSNISNQNNAYKLAYAEMASSGNPEMNSILQFIEDCKLEDTFTGYHNGDKYNSDTTHKNKGLYPQYDVFVIGDKAINIGKAEQSSGNSSSVPPVYPSILGIDLGLYGRDTGDLYVSKTILNAEIMVNGKHQKYNYKDRIAVDEDGDGNEDDWEIEVRAADYGQDNYYQQEYTRPIRPADYLLDNSNSGTSTGSSGDNARRNQLANARARALGATEEQELKVFVTYKIKVKNQSSTIIMVPNEINDYFDKSYKINGDVTPKYKNNSYGQGSASSSVSDGEKYNILTIKDDTLLSPGASVEYTIKFEVLKATDNENEIANRIILGEKENLVEVMKYSSYYPDGYEIPDQENSKKLVSSIYGETNPAFGTFDVDSTPGNLKPENIDIKQLRSLKGEEYTRRVKELFEDDSDMAQGFNLTLTDNPDDQRTIQGIVFEDSRQSVNNDLNVSLGDGQLGSGDTTINGVTVQFVELNPNTNSEFILREFGSEFGAFYNDSQDMLSRISGIDAKVLGQGSGNVPIEEPIIKARRPSSDNVNTTPGEELVLPYDLGGDCNGKFVFHAFPAGEYEIRFIYGNTIRTVLVNRNSDANEDAKSVSQKIDLDGDNSKSYTGNDYKSTIFGGDYSSEDQFTNYIHNLGSSSSASVAKDIWEKPLYNDYHGTRTYVNDYSSRNLTNERAEILASATSLQRNGNDSNDSIRSRLDKLMKETYMKAETGRVTIEIESKDFNADELESETEGGYKIDNMNLGLTERPKSQIKLEKEVENVVITLADGTVLFDASGSTANVTWKNNDRFKDYYNSNKLVVKNDNKQINTIAEIDQARTKMAGLVNLYMDEELMHGAQIKITYRIIATNIGEVDFKDQEFYYTGQESNALENIVKTTVNDIFDFVPNNLQFTAGMNTNVWEVAEESLIKDIMNNSVLDKVGEYNTVIHMGNGNNIKKELVPEIFTKTNYGQGTTSTASDLLVLTSTLSPESVTDKLSYDNVATVVNTDNTVGRRHEYSVAGNGSGLGFYIDMATAKAETVTVLPPFGQTDNTILIVSAVAGVLVIIGLAVFIIRRKTAKND